MQKNPINADDTLKLANAYIGEGILIENIDISTTGMKYKDLSDLIIPTVVGYRFAGFIYGTASTYRWFPLHLDSAAKTLHYQVVAAYATPMSLRAYPIYRRS